MIRRVNCWASQRETSPTVHPGEAQIKQRLEQGGYSDIRLHEKAGRQRDGTAMKSGHNVNIEVTPGGAVVEK